MSSDEGGTWEGQDLSIFTLHVYAHRLPQDP